MLRISQLVYSCTSCLVNATCLQQLERVAEVIAGLQAQFQILICAALALQHIQVGGDQFVYHIAVPVILNETRFCPLLPVFQGGCCHLQVIDAIVGEMVPDILYAPFQLISITSFHFEAQDRFS